MGRRKSKRKPPPKKKMTGDLDSQFTCPFCNHEKSCDVKMERSRNTGIISCTVCLEEFQTPITCILPETTSLTRSTRDQAFPFMPAERCAFPHRQSATQKPSDANQMKLLRVTIFRSQTQI
ncbi:Transcription elongation factor 1-like protein [Nibea albiflora]|uniref:Transcription elongation factor 1-like protein n=1 Tax=Nibea albiflora TaxID=240163 RepID=A0ACB7FNY9_NIBAL|nr:Transcription elongation factor 1-like protein [Nibea albiflora]